MYFSIASQVEDSWGLTSVVGNHPCIYGVQRMEYIRPGPFIAISRSLPESKQHESFVAITRP